MSLIALSIEHTPDGVVVAFMPGDLPASEIAPTLEAMCAVASAGAGIALAESINEIRRCNAEIAKQLKDLSRGFSLLSSERDAAPEQRKSSSCSGERR
ncbi:hypothetical protein [Panacagrimonas sp.]|uniref:hypothetical protein n=1 Tax=Panacagrimonas sp. TaxID=2480088 RepID=UPI003B519860